MECWPIRQTEPSPDQLNAWPLTSNRQQTDPASRRSDLSLRGWLWWYFLEVPLFLWLTFAYRYRYWGAQQVPDRGPVLLVANHQSFLDPVILGVAGHHRPFHSMARGTLFRHPAFGWLIRTLRAIPIDQDGADISAVRRCVNVLREGHALVVFPEGTRTLDGTTAPFAPGTMVLIKRALPMVIPVAIEGAHDVWPRNRSLPRAVGRIASMYGQPIAAETLLAMEPGGALKHLQLEVETMRRQLARRLSSGRAAR